MAAPSISRQRYIAHTPWLVRELTITSGNTATALDHGGPAVVPDMIITRNNVTNPTASEIAVYSEDTTQITIDCESDGVATSHVIYLIWFDQNAGGIS